MGLELAEHRLLEALRSNPGLLRLDVRVVGRRRARRHAQRIGGAWIPAFHGEFPRRAEAGADLVHLVGLDLPPPRRRPFVTTIHDLSPIHYDDDGELPPWIEEIAQRARLLLTPSAFSAREIQTHLGVPAERIRVFGGGPALDARSARPLSADELSELGIAPPFALRYGGYTKRKNVPRLLDAWRRVGEGTLVLAGPAHLARQSAFAATGPPERVVVLDYVSAEVLARLLKTASLLVSTSVYEGFGLPPLEALAAGTPVVAVETPFVREVCGDAALLVDDDPDDIASAIEAIFHDPPLAASLRREGTRRAASMTWEGAAAEVVRAYHDACAF
jgi:glycosyltransferase involved in cell wall biosynthesis